MMITPKNGSCILDKIVYVALDTVSCFSFELSLSEHNCAKDSIRFAWIVLYWFLNISKISFNLMLKRHEFVLLLVLL